MVEKIEQTRTAKYVRKKMLNAISIICEMLSDNNRHVSTAVNLHTL